MNPANANWRVINFLFIISRMGVPLFFMCSGMTMFRRKHGIREIFLSSIPKILIPYFFWMLIYGVSEAINSSTPRIAVNSIIKAVIFGHYHTWFIATLIGLYIITPLVQEFIYDSVLLRYAIVLSLIFTVITPYVSLVGDNRVENVINDFNMHFVVGYILYFLLGYFLGNTQLVGRNALLYGAPILFFLVICQFLCVTKVGEKGQDIQNYFSAFSVICVIISSLIFLFVRTVAEKIDAPKLVTAVMMLESFGIGIYLVHPLFLPLINGMHGYIRIIGAMIVYICALLTNAIIYITPLKKLLLK